MDGRDWNFWLYLFACLAIPAVWGVASAWVFDRIDRRRGARGGEPPPDRPMVDYTI